MGNRAKKRRTIVSEPWHTKWSKTTYNNQIKRKKWQMLLLSHSVTHLTPTTPSISAFVSFFLSSLPTFKSLSQPYNVPFSLFLLKNNNIYIWWQFYSCSSWNWEHYIWMLITSSHVVILVSTGQRVASQLSSSHRHPENTNVLLPTNM